MFLAQIRYQHAAIKSISTEAPTAKPVTPIHVRAGSLSLAKYDALVCPHTAVGLHVAEKFQSYNNRVPMITLATAHTSKFPESVRRATGRNPELPQQYSDLLSREELFAEKDKDLEDLKTYIKMRLEN